MYACITSDAASRPFGTFAPWAEKRSSYLCRNCTCAPSVLINMDQLDGHDSVWSGARRFASRHSRVITLIVAAVAICASLLVLAPSLLVATATPLTEPVRLKSTISVTFLDKDGKVIGRQGPIAGQYVKLAQLPAYVPQALLAMEDRRFYAHHGIDLLGLSRAAYSDVRARRVVAGGSTISQQTAKLLFTDGSRTFHRKFHELANATSPGAFEDDFPSTAPRRPATRSVNQPTGIEACG